MINIQTDLMPLSSSSFSKMNMNNLQRIATEGTDEQKDQLISWAHSGVAAFIFEDLCILADRKEWIHD